MGLNDGILDFEGRRPKEIFFKGVMVLDFFFFWFSRKVSEQSDQVARKLDLW